MIPRKIWKRTCHTRVSLYLGMPMPCCFMPKLKTRSTEARHRQHVDAVNQIVNRATGGVPNPADPLFTTAMSKEEFDAAVIQQRSWELCFEYDRWFDIQRKRILYEVTDPDYQQNYNVEDYLLPIPPKDLRLNKNLVQNPGYTNPNGK